MPDEGEPRGGRGRRRASAALALLVAAAGVTCRAPPTRQRTARADGREGRETRGTAHVVRVAIGSSFASGTLDADGAWEVLAADRVRVLARVAAGETYQVAGVGRTLSVTRSMTERAAAAGEPTIVARPKSPGGSIRWNGRRYRGEIIVSAAATGLLVVNRVLLDDYLRGVVPREVGSLAARDRAAIEAQAVASRSYALAHLATPARDRGYDVSADFSHQVYGGADAERPASDAAVAATAGQVLLYAGHVVDAAYHSTCGGSTAEPDEVWQERSAPPYLRRVSDRVPGTSRWYCDISPRFSWRRAFDGRSLDAAIDRYLRSYVAVAPGGPGAVRAVRVAGRTPSGRVAELVLDTDGGRYAVRGNQIRSVLRTVGGEILNSTYFTVDTMLVGANGHVAQLILRGAGNGHGVGMCQWGAVGRARAGHDYRAILQAYYPGTTLGYIGGSNGR